MSSHRSSVPGSGLHQCCVCHADFVVPVDWNEADEHHWRILLRCGECETSGEIIVTDDVAKRLELDIERGVAEIASTLRRLDRMHMAVLLATFVAALNRDLIDASDFARR